MLGVMLLVFWVPLMAAGAGAWAGAEAAAALGWAAWAGGVVCGLVGLALAAALVRRVEKNSAAGAGLTISRIIDSAACGAAAIASEE